MATQDNELFANVSSFSVKIDGANWTNYESVSGIGMEFEDIPFQAGDRNEILNRPGRCNARDITLTRRFRNDKDLYSWVKMIKDGKVKEARRSGSIRLLDDQQKEICRYDFFGAWPKKWIAPPLSKDGTGNNILIEEITLSVESVDLV